MKLYSDGICEIPNGSFWSTKGVTSESVAMVAESVRERSITSDAGVKARKGDAGVKGGLGC